MFDEVCRSFRASEIREVEGADDAVYGGVETGELAVLDGGRHDEQSCASCTLFWCRAV